MNRKAMLNLIAPVSFLVFFFTAVSARAQGVQGRKPATTNVVYAVAGMNDVSIHANIVYKKGGETQLVFDAYAPKNLPPGRKLPAIVFISGADNAKDWRWFTDYGRLADTSRAIIQSTFAFIKFNTQ
jgi:predicted peptidase